SKLVKTAQSKVLTGDSKAKFKNQPSRKEHQSALPKDQQKALQTLSKVLLSKPQFQKYGITRSVRISSSPFEDKIGGKSAQLPLGSFIKAVENWAKNSPSDDDTTIYKTELDTLKPLFAKAKISDRFEGMEVLRDLTHPDFRASAKLNRALASKDIQDFSTIVADFKSSVHFTTISGSVNSGAPAPSSTPHTPSAASQLGKLCDALGLPDQAKTIRGTSPDKLQATLTGMQKTEFAKKDPNSVFLNFHAATGLAGQAAVADPVIPIITLFSNNGVEIQKNSSARKIAINVTPSSTTITQELHFEAADGSRTSTGKPLQKDDIKLKMVVTFTIDHDSGKISMEKQFPEHAVIAPLKEKVSPETWADLTQSLERHNIDISSS
ncbi:hypothetical protein HOH45_00390, partial [bacterium]|nr:hypothetical protein [bacterium]